MNRDLPRRVCIEYPRRVMDHLSVSVLVLDHTLRLRYMNPAAEMMLAISLRQASGQRFRDLAQAVKLLYDSMERALAFGHPFTERELQLQLTGERNITVDCTVTPMLDREPSPELLVEMRQVDHQLRISREEHQLAQYNTTRALVRNLAHEIKNPLGGLRGAAQLLERELGDASLKEYTGVIIGEADRLRTLVDRLLGPTQLPTRREVNLHEMLERVRTLLLAEAGSGILIERDYDPSIPVLVVDHDQIIQALLNIAGNAVQALGERGRIVLRTRVQRQITIGHRRHRLLARIDIIDNGPGIPPELIERVFYPMITGRPDGTGLGLSIAQSLINQHGGLIECSSRPGETMFTILLPLEVHHG